MSSNITKDYLKVIKENDKLRSKLNDHDELKEQTKSQEKEICKLKRMLSARDEKIEELQEENKKLKAENDEQRETIARLLSRLNRDSSNSSIPTGRDTDTPTERKFHDNQPAQQEESKNEVTNCEDNSSNNEERSQGEPVNHYNSRSKDHDRKAGGQKGHQGETLTLEKIDWLMENYATEFEIEHIGDANSPDYYSQFVIDIKPVILITERRFHKGEIKKEDHRSQVIYGNTIKALSVLLFVKYNLSYQKITQFVKHLTDGAIEMSMGTAYDNCKVFTKLAKEEAKEIRKRLLEQEILGTDSTVMVTGGKTRYIRVFNNSEIVYYEAMKTKTLEEMRERTILPDFKGGLIHDHETALYHFGAFNSECLAHVKRYNLRTSDETGNLWPWMMDKFFGELQHERKQRIKNGEKNFFPEEIECFSRIYDEIIALGRKENKHTLFGFARDNERALLNKYTKFKSNHLLFLTDFRIEPDNNRSERNLRECKVKKKVSGGFRTFQGLENYAAMKTVIDNLDLNRNVLKEIALRFAQAEAEVSLFPQENHKSQAPDASLKAA